MNSWARVKSKSTLLLALVAAVALLAACSSSKSSSSAPGVSGKTVTIGGGEVVTGPFNFLLPFTYGVQAWVKWVNDHGGINGYTFNYDTADNAYDPSRSLTVMKKLVNQDHVFAVVGDVGTIPNNAVMPFIKQTGIPDIAPGFSSDPFVKEPGIANYFPANPVYRYATEFLAQFLTKQKSVAKLGLLYENNDVGTVAKAGFEAYAQHENLSVGPELAVDPTAVDMSSYVSRMKDAGVDGIVWWGASIPQLSTAEKDAAGSGYHPLWAAGFYNADPSLFKLSNGLANGTTFFDSYMVGPDASTPAASDYRAALAKYFPNAQPGLLSQQGFAAGEIFGEAFKKATANGQKPTWKDLEAALNTLSDWTGSLVYSVTYTSSRHIGSLKEVVVAAQDNKFVPVTQPAAVPQY